MTTVDGGSAVPPVADPAPEIVIPAASAAAAAPVMTTATTPARLAAGNPVAWLAGGTDPLAPFAEPLAWAALAVTRRELSAAAVVSPAATVGTAQPAASALSDLLSQADVTTALVGVAKQFVLDVVGGGDLGAALQTGLQSLDANPLFQNVSVASLLSDPALPQSLSGAADAVITALAADPDVRAAVGNGIAGVLGSAIANIPGAEAISAAVTGAVTGLLADPATAGALGGIAGTALNALLGQTGVVSALAGVADQISAIVAGGDPAAALDSVWQSLRASAPFLEGVTAAVNSAVTSVIADSGVVQALGSAVTGLVAGVTGDPALQAILSDGVTGFLTSVLTGIPASGGIVAGLRDAVLGLLADPVAGDALAQAAGSALADFLGQPGLADALSGVVAQITTAVVDGSDPLGALQAGWHALQADSAFASALSSTLANALTGLVGDSGLVATLGVAATALVSALSGDPAFATIVSGLVGPQFGDAILSILSDPAAAGSLAELLGSALTSALNVPGLSGAIADAANQFAAAVTAGVSLLDGLQTVLQSLQSVVLSDVLSSALSGALAGILSDSSVQQVVGDIAQVAVSYLVGGFAGPVVGAVAQAAVDSLLASMAVQNLIGDIAVDAVSGTPVSDLLNVAISAVVSDPALQIALGNALGDGTGAIFGDNPIGFVVSRVVGATATLVIGVVAGVVSLLSGFGIAVIPGAGAAKSDSSDYLIEQIPTAAIV